MYCFLLLSAFGVAALGAPQGYGYKEPAPVFERNGFQPITPFKSLPCIHATHHTGDAASALIESQSTARIVNHQKHYSADHNLVTAASGYSPQSQLSTAIGSYGKVPSQAIPASQGYFLSGANIVTQFPPQIQAQQFNSHSVGSGQHTISSHKQGYDYNNAIPSHGQNYELHHNQHNNFPATSIPVQSYDNVNTGFQHGVGGNGGSFDSIGHLYAQTASSTAAHKLQHTQHTANAGSALNFGAVGSLNGQLGHVIQETFAKAPLDPTAEKHIYVHVPPEDIEESYNQHSVIQHQLPTTPKKHYKIIFIKAPSAPVPNYSQLAAAAVPQTEEKTLVYVLVKKPDEPSLEEIQQIQQSSYKSNKPEVYFIKYKTHKESESGQYSPNLQIPTELIEQQQNTGALVNDATALIDIRSAGESSSTSTSNSYTSSTGPISDGPKHELYGVPLN